MSPAVGSRLAEMRAAFDRSFTSPPPVPVEVVDLLAVTVGADAVAVELSAVAGLVADRPVTRLPGAPPALLGVAGLRGHLVPVYDLAAVLGGPGAPGRGTDRPRWLILVAGSPAVAVAVARIDAHLRLPRDAIATPEPRDDAAPAGGPRAMAVAHTPDGLRPVIDMAAVRAAIAS